MTTDSESGRWAIMNMTNHTVVKGSVTHEKTQAGLDAFQLERETGMNHEVINF